MKKPNTIYLKDYTPPDFLVDKIDLVFEIEEEETRVISHMKVRRNTAAPDEKKPLIFNKGAFEITRVVANDMVLLPVEYGSDDKYFKLAGTPETFELEITSVLTPGDNTSLEGLYPSGDILCTQCEAQGFRRITPFPDRPDVMATYTCTIIADKTKYPVLLSNGNPVQTGDLDGNRHFVRWEDPHKKPSYLFALVAGDLAHIEDRFITCSGRPVDLKIYSEKENIDKCAHAMESLKQAMKWDEERFGLEYDLDLYQIVAINDFNAGAMENKGLNIFNSKYVLANPETATDEDFMNIQGVIGHEYFHNWTGNRVTLKNWFQLSLKEGLTVFRDQEFSSDINSRGVKRIGSVQRLRGHQFPEDAGPMAHPVRPDSYIKMDNFYTMTVYEKGSEVIRMIHQLLGEESFRNGIDLYFKKFDGMAVTIEDFVAVMEEASSLDLSQFTLWYFQSGTPCVTMSRKYDAKKRELHITFEQSTPGDRNQSVKKPFHIPVNFGIIDSRGNDITPPGKSLIELRKPVETVTFKDIPEQSLPSVFRQFSAPVKIKTDFSEDELAFLMSCDTDEVNRWDAAQTLFLNEIKRLVTAIETGGPTAVSPTLIQAFQSALTDEKTDRAFLSKVLFIPTEIEIKEHFNPINVAAIHEARGLLRKEAAKKLKNDFLSLIEICSKSDATAISHDAMADRSLKNLCLSYIGCLDEKESAGIVKHHFESAENMTDELSAFTILAKISSETKKEAVKRFHSKWKANKLVLDKWFSVQAGSSLPDTLDCISPLLEHEDFSIKNPNKVRSLIYFFALSNPINFHREDHEGYRFIADQIIRLDGINQMVAARLSTCFNLWKKYDEKRKAGMKKELERIIAIPSLSKNVYEIVSRALN